TRLSLQCAARVLDTFPEGVWLAELAPLADSALVPWALANVLDVREQPGRPMTETLVEHVSARRLLLLLDNCEHLVGAVATLTETLLRACPDLRILTTSREPLSVEGEVTWRVPSLTLPDADCLFVERAQAALPAFRLTAQNASAVARICHRLDGIPLALELAAARVRALSVEQIASRLDDRLRLLASGERTAPARQQTLRAAVDWSYELLSEPEQILLRRLSVFAGWNLEMA